LTKAKIKSYALALADIPIENLEAALAATIRDPGQVFFPSAAEIRAHFEKTKKVAIGSAADAAWLDVQRYISEWRGFPEKKTIVTNGELVTISRPKVDPNTNYAIAACGGLDAIAETSVEYAHFARARFVEAFERYADREASALIPASTARAFLDQVRKAAESTTEGSGVDEIRLNLPSTKD
jgi:hypothetical protein